jgi:hypothetical protein
MRINRLFKSRENSFAHLHNLKHKCFVLRRQFEKNFFSPPSASFYFFIFFTSTVLTLRQKRFEFFSFHFPFCDGQLSMFNNSNYYGMKIPFLCRWSHRISWLYSWPMRYFFFNFLFKKKHVHIQLNRFDTLKSLFNIFRMKKNCSVFINHAQLINWMWSMTQFWIFMYEKNKKSILHLFFDLFNAESVYRWLKSFIGLLRP